MEKGTHHAQCIRFATFEVDLQAGELRKNGRKLKFSGQPFQVLAILLEQPAAVVTREELQKRLWPDTFVDVDHNLNTAINKIREVLGDSAENPRFVETLPRRGYRFIHPVTTATDSRVVPRTDWMKKMAVPAAVITAVMLLAGWVYLRSQSKTKLTEKDTLVLADFENNAGDPIFDVTLKQALVVGLQQSPFLKILSDRKVQDTLKLMERKPDERLTREVAMEVCQRTSSAAVLEGSISSLGRDYVVGLNVVNCRTGDRLAQEQAQAAKKEEVLKALDQLTLRLRTKLGESRTTVQKFDTPLEEATTSSLEALQAFSLAQKISNEKGDYAATVPLFERAIKLDPNFAMAYAGLARTLAHLGEVTRAEQNRGLAYARRDRVSEQERFFIEEQYYERNLGNLEKALQVAELWSRTYPRDSAPFTFLGDIQFFLGQPEKALAAHAEALRLDPELSWTRYELVSDYMVLNRLEEAAVAAGEAQAKELEGDYFLHGELYSLAFLRNDAAGMAEQVAWSAGKPEAEASWLLTNGEAPTAAYFGRFGNARELFRRAVASAERAGLKDLPAWSTLGYWAWLEALCGNNAEARQQINAALRLSHDRYAPIDIDAGLVFAQIGETARAQTFAVDLGKRYPEGTIINFVELPLIRAQLAISRHDAPGAIEALKAAIPYELGWGLGPNIQSAYERGQAYLIAHDGQQAAAEFQKILDHRGLVVNMAIGALAHLGLARAYALQGETAKAIAKYQDFLALWKDADTDIPILKQAKAEYANLQ